LLRRSLVSSSSRCSISPLRICAIGVAKAGGTGCDLSGELSPWPQKTRRNAKVGFWIQNRLRWLGSQPMDSSRGPEASTGANVRGGPALASSISDETLRSCHRACATIRACACSSVMAVEAPMISTRPFISFRPGIGLCTCLAVSPGAPQGQGGALLGDTGSTVPTWQANLRYSNCDRR
jgi:hypothetical protein